MQNARLDAQHEIDLARTEEGSEERILAEAKYDKEKRKLARKQAVLDRAQGLFNIGVSTATAIMNALAQFGPNCRGYLCRYYWGDGSGSNCYGIGYPASCLTKTGVLCHLTRSRACLKKVRNL